MESVLTDELVQFISLLMIRSSRNCIIEAIKANPRAVSFFSNETSTSFSESDPLVTAVSSSWNAYVALCEIEVIQINSSVKDSTNSKQSGLAPVRTVATTDIPILIHKMSNSSSGIASAAIEAALASESLISGQSTAVSALIAANEAGGPEKIINCVLLSKRDTDNSNEQQNHSPLSPKDLHVHTFDMEHPLDALQQLLQHFYEPVLRSRREVILRSQLQDMVSSIRSKDYGLVDVDILCFVHSDLITFSAQNPDLDPKQLSESLNPSIASDPSFIRQVLSTRNRCVAVLDIRNVLQHGRNKPRQKLAQADFGDMKPPETFALRDEIAYWQSVMRWIECVQQQLRIREWHLVHRLLAHRVETNYEPEFAAHLNQVKDYLKFLGAINSEKEIEAVEPQGFLTLADSIFSTLLAPSKYPPQLRIMLLSSLVSSLTSRLIDFISERDVLPFYIQPSESGYSVSKEIHALPTKVQQVVWRGRLEALRSFMSSLIKLQESYISCSSTLRTQARVVLSAAESKTANHPQLSNAYERCKSIRWLIETHFQVLGDLQRILAQFKEENSFNPQDLDLSIDHTFSKYSESLRKAYFNFPRSAHVARGSTPGSLVMAESEAQRGPSLQSEAAPSFDVLPQSLWDFTPEDNANFRGALKQYEECIIATDEGLSTCAEKVLAHLRYTVENTHQLTGESESNFRCFFRFFSFFRDLRLPKVQAVVQRFQSTVTEYLDSQVKESQERYFSVKESRCAMKYMAATLKVSPLVAKILWTKNLEQELSNYLVAKDYVSESGWNQLLSLRTLENRWRLNETLAQFLGFSLQDLTTSQLKEDSEVHGTAYALACLELLFGDDQIAWECDAHLNDARNLVSESDPSSLQIAKSRLLAIGVGQNSKKDQMSMKSVRTVRATVAQRLLEDVTRWCEESRKRIVSLEINPSTFILRNPLFSILTLPGNTGSGKKSEDVTSLSVSFFWGLELMIQDMSALNSVDVLGGSVEQLVNIVREFIRQNQHRVSQAVCLSELLRVFYEVSRGEDETVLLLATQEYTLINETLLAGAKLRWSDDAAVSQFLGTFSNQLQQLCLRIADVRKKTDLVEGKIWNFKQRAYHPDAIVQRVLEMHTVVQSLVSRCSNATSWVDSVRLKLNDALVEQITAIVQGWTYDFLSLRDDNRFLDKNVQTSTFGLKPLRLTMRIIYKEARLDSSPAAWRRHWTQEFNKVLSWLHTLPKLGYVCDDASVDCANFNKGEYSGLLDLVPISVFKEAFDAIERCIQEAIEVEMQWKNSQCFLSLDIGVMQQRYGTDLSRWNIALQHIRSLTVRLMDFTQPNKLLGGIVILSEDAQKDLGKKLDRVSQYINNKFKNVLDEHLQNTYKVIGENRVKTEKYNVINDLTDAAAFLVESPQMKSEIGVMESHIGLMLESESSLKKLGYAFPDNWISASKVKEEFRSLKESFDRKLEALEFRTPFLLEMISNQVHLLEDKLKELEKEFYDLGNATTKQNPETSQKMISEFHGRALKHHEEMTRVSSIQKALGIPALPVHRLNALLGEAEKLKQIWDYVAVVYKQLDTLGGTPFFELVPRRLHEELTKIEKGLLEYPEALQNSYVYTKVLENVRSAINCRRVMQELRSDAMSPLERAERHWMALKRKLNVTWILEDLTVRDIWESDPISNVGKFAEVLEIAQGEHRLEVQLSQISSFWENFIFSLTIFQKRVALVRNWDELFERLADDLSTFTGMRASPFFSSPQVIALTNESERKLNLLRQIFEILLEVQKRWVYLDGIFSGNSEIRSQLPQESILFDRTTKELLQIMPSPTVSNDTPEIRADFFLNDPKLLGIVERLYSQLSQVQRSLSTYLDTQRQRFPRFFFVGDDDLLEIMGSGKNPTSINRHLKKMFTAISVLLVDQSLPRIAGFASTEGEEVRFEESDAIPFLELALYDWLGGVERGMVSRLKHLAIEAFEELKSTGKATLGWLERFPVQILCLSAQIWWVHMQEADFSQESTEGKGKKMSKALQAMVTLLQQLASDVLSPSQSSSIKRRCEQLITVAVYQRDTSRALVAKKIYASTSFDWISKLRFYAIERTGSRQMEVEGRMSDAVFVHGFEYLGGYERLVQTPLTDKCYATLTQALHARYGGSPVGPAGTGKTETVKALGAQLGRHVLVFNCDESFDFQAVSRIFLGLCQVGAWGCFDEFNRLEERILSAISLQIQTIQEALRSFPHSDEYSTGETSKWEVTLNARSVPLNPNVALFITMNPGYAGRSNLPGNLKQLFYTVTMVAPDRETIAEVMLFSRGFRTAESLSRKIVPLFKLCEDQFSRQAHYDFGLRALKSVLVAAGELRRAYSAKNSGAGELDGSEAAENACDNVECQLILESIVSNVAPKLVKEDSFLFRPLLRDFFPGHEIPDPTSVNLTKAVERVCLVSGLVTSASWVEKICHIYHTSKTRHGIMLVGRSGTGKTMAWKTLLSALTLVSNETSHAYVIEPKVLAKGELFGSLDVTTREWKDGVFTTILRRIIEATRDEGARVVDEQNPMELEHSIENNTSSRKGKASVLEESVNDSVKAEDSSFGAPSYHRAQPMPSSKQSKRHQHWIIFDGDVDPEWVENLNSVLDDNKILTLPNGERLALPDSVRLIFEVETLEFATPATVSRCGMVWFSRDTIPIASILSFLHHQIRAKDFSSVSGDEVKWNTEPGMTGAGSVYGVKTSRGKLFGEFVYRNDSHFARGLGAQTGNNNNNNVSVDFTLNFGIDSNLDQDEDGIDEFRSISVNSCAQSKRDNTIRRGSLSVLKKTMDGVVGRIHGILVEEWAAAFSPAGLIVKGLHLITDGSLAKVGIMEYNPIQLIHGIVSILLCSISNAIKAEKTGAASLSDVALKKYAANCILYSVFWGLGAPLSYVNRATLADKLDLNPAVGTSIMDVEVDPTTGGWKDVRSKVRVMDITAQQVGSTDTVIPTVDTSRHESIINAWILSGRSAILCGPPGSGKTMSITAVMKTAKEYDMVFLNFSSGTNADMVFKALLQHCRIENTASGLVMRSISGKKIILFCDEINLPSLDKYGTQVVIQLLRQLIERQGFFRPADNTWIHLENVQIIGACNPPTDPGRVPLSHRFLRWAPVLFVDFPSKESLITIYTTYCRAILSFSQKLKDNCAKKLAQAMVNFYCASQSKFTPLIQPHYLYSPRELSRWCRAIYEGIQTIPMALRSEWGVNQLIRLSLHEGLRVFRDRLVQEGERAWTDKSIDSEFKASFPEVDKSVFARPLLYSALLGQTYTDCPVEKLRIFIKERLDLFCEEVVTAPLVIFDSMIDHVLRIDRVLRQPLGHLLIAGSSGVGKTMTARLVAWMSGFSVVWIKVHRDYDIEDFEADLRDILRRAGCKRERLCFIFDESNIMEPSFLEYMNALLASGEVPGLFDGDIWKKLMQDIRESISLSHPQGASNISVTDHSEVKTPHAASKRKAAAESTAAAAGMGAYVDLSSEYELYRWFLNNVKEYLHVIFTINPSSAGFSSRAVASPALFNRCTIDWFGDWDVSTLKQVTRELTKNVKVMYSFKDVFLSEEEALESMADAICQIHEITHETSTLIRAQRVNHGTFITPRHFCDFVGQFVKLYSEKQGGSTEQLRHLRDGLQKLSESSKEVEEQQLSLREGEKELDISSKRAQTMLEQIVSETDTTKKEKKNAESLRVQLQEEQIRIQEDQQQVQKELAEAEPALVAAENALSTVKQEHLREMRAYATPPPMAKRVIEAVVTLMGELHSEDWDVLKGYVRRDDFITSVKQFRSINIREEARERVKLMLKDSRFTIEAANRASKAAGPLLQWVIAQMKYMEIYVRVEPMRKRIEELSSARGVKLRDLDTIENLIKEKEELLVQLKTGYQQTTEEIAEIKQRIAVVSARCGRATSLFHQLLHERDRWSSEIESFDVQARTTVGDTLISAAFLSYIGFFDVYSRQHLFLPKWHECLQNKRIPFRSDLLITKYLVLPEQRLGWEQSGLPKDNLCVENATILHRTQRYPLLIDPSGTAVEFLQHHYHKEKVKKTSFMRHDCLKQLEMAVRFGYPIIIEDAEFLDPALGPLINKEVHNTGGRAFTRIGAHDVDMSNTFKLFLITRHSNYQPSPSIAGQVCLINFTVTLSSLQSQCLYQLLLSERPDIDIKRRELVKTQGEYQVRLRVLEQELLTTIAASEGSLIENNQLIVTLENLKKESTAIQEDIARSEESLQLITNVENRYLPLASAAAKSFFALRKLSDLCHYYRYDVWFIFNVLRDALKSLPPRSTATTTTTASSLSEGEPYVDVEGERLEVEQERLERLTKVIFSLVYQRAVRGMFREDQLVLALRLAQLRSAMRDSTSRIISEEDWEMLLDGVRMVRISVAGKSSVGGATSNKAILPDFLVSEGVLPTLSGGKSAAESSLYEVLSRPCFSAIFASMKNPDLASVWKSFFQSHAPLETEIPDLCFEPSTHPARKAFLLAILLFHTRRDAFAAAITRALHLFFDGGEAPQEGGFFPWETYDLAKTLPELSESTPLVMIIDASSDPSFEVELLARQKSVPLRVVAMGSSEGIVSAGHYLQESMQSGFWVLLKNVHLALKYLDTLEKKIHQDRLENILHPNFRLFLTAEKGSFFVPTEENFTSSSVLPISLLERSVVVVHEPPPGVKSSLLQTFGSLEKNRQLLDYVIPKQREVEKISDAPIRIFFAAAWLHAVVMERLFYVPLGWSRLYEYTEMEFWRSCQTLNLWHQYTHSGGNHSSGKKISGPDGIWKAVQTLIAAIIYGGKITNDFDQYVLQCFCSNLLNSGLITANADLRLAEGKNTNLLLASTVAPPSDSSPDAFHSLLEWIHLLPDENSPSWVNLPSSSSRMIHANQGLEVVERFNTVQLVWDDDVASKADRVNKLSGSPKANLQTIPIGSIQRAKMGKKIEEYCVSWLPTLQATQKQLEPYLSKASTSRTAEESVFREHGAKDAADPIELCIARELDVAANLIKHVVHDVAELLDVYEGKRNMSTSHLSLMNALMKDHTPLSWSSAYVTESPLVGPWIVDMKRRVEHVVELYEAIDQGKLHQLGIQLGFLFNPGAFLTASKQQAARKQQRPLEQLELLIDIYPSESAKDIKNAKKSPMALAVDSLYLVNLNLYSAQVEPLKNESISYACSLIHNSSALVSIYSKVSIAMSWVPTHKPPNIVDHKDLESHPHHESILARLLKQEAEIQEHVAKNDKWAQIVVPMYLNGKREHILDIVELPISLEKIGNEDDLKKNTFIRSWYQRGVCLTL